VKRPFTPHGTKAVFFDMNNTLIDPKASFDACFLSVLADYTGRWDDGDAGRSPQRALATYRNEWSKKANALRLKPGEKEAAKKRCLQIALRHYPFQVNDAFVASFFREMRHQAREHAVLFDDAADAVGKLADPYTLGIITNGSKEQQEQVVAKLNLSPYIAGSRIFASNKGGVRKPNPAIFLGAARSVGVDPSQCVMIGDSWKNDVSGALKAGMRAVWLNRSKTGRSVRRAAGKIDIPVVGSFNELAELFVLKP